MTFAVSSDYGLRISPYFLYLDVHLVYEEIQIDEPRALQPPNIGVKFPPPSTGYVLFPVNQSSIERLSP